MSDNIKLIIEIPKPMYENVQNGTYCGTLYEELKNGIPLDSVKAEIKEKCDRIDDIARANIYQYAPHREIQDLLCEILASIGNTESDLKGWTTEEMLEQIRKENNDNPEDISCDHYDRSSGDDCCGNCEDHKRQSKEQKQQA